MKLKIMVLLLALVLVLYGCNNKTDNQGTTESGNTTTLPASQILNNGQEPTMPDLSESVEGSQEVIVHPDGTIELPPIIFDDEFEQTGSITVVTPTEPVATEPTEPTEPVEPSEPEPVTDPDEEIWIEIPVSDELPDDIWE